MKTTRRLPARSAHLAALLVVVAIALSGARAQATPAALPKTRETSTSKTWTASGTTFRHTATKIIGQSGWERATTGKRGATTLRGRNPLGSDYTGSVWQRDGRTYRETTEGDGHSLTTTEPNGTVRTRITWPWGSRDITTWWGAGGRVLTHVRNRAPDGKLTSEWRAWE